MIFWEGGHHCDRKKGTMKAGEKDVNSLQEGKDKEGGGEKRTG